MPTDGRDPSGYVTAPPSVVVKVVGTARNDINGLFGIVISYNMERERYLVHMTKSQSTMALKKENLVKASMLESYRAQIQQLQNDARVREKMQKYLNLCQQYVAPMKLSHVVGGVVFVWFTLLVFVGFVKTVMTTSMITLLIIMIGPDLMSRSPPQVILQNFPERARSTMEKQLPFLKGRLTNRMAVGVVAFLVLLCLQSLFLTSSSSTSSNKRPKAIQSPTNKAAAGSKTTVVLDRMTLEKFYNMGFDDATNGVDKGTSLLQELETLNLLVDTTSDNENMDGTSDDDQLSSSSSSSPLDPLFVEGGAGGDNKKSNQTLLSKITNMTNLASVFYLYRSMIELGTDQTTNLFSMGQLAANMQHHTEWWRKILLALSLYNVLRIFF